MTGTPGEEDVVDPEIVDDAPVVEPEKVETPKPPTFEDIAAGMGWAPKDKWRGPPEAWKDAPTFISSTTDINKRISSDLRETKETLKRLSATSAAITDREIAKREAELIAQFDAAVEAGDKATARKVSDAIRENKADPIQVDHLADFRARNPWYGDDVEASDLAYKTAEVLSREGKDIPAQLKKAEEVVRKKFPALFGAVEDPAPARKQAPLVADPQSRTAERRSKTKGVSDLPADAKRAGEDFVRRGRVASLDEYASVYWQENA